MLRRQVDYFQEIVNRCNSILQIFTSSLYEISPYAPTEVTLPVEPVDKLLNSNLLVPYDEKFVLSEQERDGARKALAAQVALGKGETASLGVMKAEECTYSYYLVFTKFKFVSESSEYARDSPPPPFPDPHRAGASPNAQDSTSLPSTGHWYATHRNGGSR